MLTGRHAEEEAPAPAASQIGAARSSYWLARLPAVKGCSGAQAYFHSLLILLIPLHFATFIIIMPCILFILLFCQRQPESPVVVRQLALFFIHSTHGSSRSSSFYSFGFHSALDILLIQPMASRPRGHLQPMIKREDAGAGAAASSNMPAIEKAFSRRKQPPAHQSNKHRRQRQAMPRQSLKEVSHLARAQNKQPWLLRLKILC